MPKYRLPDLWLKVELARAAAECTNSGWLSGRNMSDCMTPNPGDADASTNSQTANNKRMFGGLMCDDVVLRNLAAALEYMVTQTVDGDFVRNAQAMAAGGRELQLYPAAILGTYHDFARAILLIGTKGIGVETLVETVRQALEMEAPRGRAEPLPLEVEGTRDALTPMSQRGRERIVYQAGRATPFLTPGTRIQIHVPAHSAGQLLYAFEHRTDAALILEPWGTGVAWLGARVQPAGRTGRLLDEDTVVEPVAGVFQVQAVGVDLPDDFVAPVSEPITASDEGLLADLLPMIRDTPKAWPPGYAKTMALLIAARRLEQPRLYCGSYGVRLGESAIEDGGIKA